MARTITYQQAINEALAQEMERDPTVVLFGEDVSGGMGSPGEEDAWGGVLGVTKGLTPGSQIGSWTRRSANRPTSARRPVPPPPGCGRWRS